MTQEFLKLYFAMKKSVSREDSLKIHDFLLHYEKHKSHIHRKVAWKIVFYKLPELCFLQHLEDSAAVSKVLSAIHHLSKTAVSLIVLFLVVNSLHRHTLSQETRSKRKEEGIVSFNFVAFFLYHSNARKLMFEGKRITEMIEESNPLLYARFLVLADWRCLLTLLQYGLRFDSSKHPSRVHSIFLYILERLKEFSQLEKKHQRMTLTNDTDHLNPKLLLLLHNLKLILRSTYNPHSVIYRMAAYCAEDSGTTDVEEFNAFIHEFVDLEMERVPKLKHFCRYIIRERLFDNWHLPHGIRHLSLKPDLGNYLYMCSD